MKDAPAAAPHASAHEVLRVAAGLHQGAQIRLRRPGLLLLGSADDCDVILMDTGVARRHAAVTLNEEGVAVRALESSVSIDERDLPPGEWVTWPDGGVLRLGAATVVIASDPEPTQSDTLPPTAQHSAHASGAERPALRQRVLTRIAAGCAAVGLAAALAIALAPFSTVESAIENPDQHITSLLARLGLQEDIRWSSEQGKLSLTGITHDEESYAALMRELAAHSLTPHLQVTSPARAAADVKEVFRVNGFDVDAQYSQGGVVLVRGLAATKQEADRVVEHALEDVPGLKDIRIADGNATLLDSTTSIPVDRAAKRVVAIVNGSPAYVVTADGSRYFVGALLPQGQRVVAIDGASVTLEREGKQLVMNF